MSVQEYRAELGLDRRQDPREPRRRGEDAIQRAIVTTLRLILEPPALVYHVPNGGARTYNEAAIMQGLGVFPGVADLCLIWPGGRSGYLEVKAERGKLTEHQRAFRDRCADLGIPYAVVRSVREAIACLEQWEVPHIPARVSP